jgi:integral membrane protein
VSGAVAETFSLNSLRGAFYRFRILAFVTGTLLILLVFVAIPIKYWGDNSDPVAVIGTAHGFLFMVYLVTGFDLGIRLRWPLLKLGAILIAGTIPFASFFAEHRAKLDLQAKEELATAAG